MKKDKDLLKELLRSKFEDECIESSKDMFDNIYDTVSKGTTEKIPFYWYRIAAAILFFIGLGSISYYLKENTLETNIQKPIVVHKSPEINTDSIQQKTQKPTIKFEENKKSLPQEKIQIAEETPKASIETKTKDTSSTEKDKSKIDVSYVTTQKYASSKYSKYVKLPDTSTIVLQKSSRVNYKRSIENYRTVELTGNVFFDVKKDSTKPFIVITKNSKVQVIGTKFVMSSRNNEDYLYLIEGSVNIVHIKTGQDQIVIPGQSFRISDDGIRKLDKTPNQFAWKTGNLHYRNTKVKEVFEDLRKNFDIKINVLDPTLLNCKYTGSFRKTTPEKMINILSATLKVNVQKKNNLFIISGNSNCLN